MNERPKKASAIQHRISLRLKLTLWMLAIFLIIQVSLATVLDLYHERSVESFSNDRLARRIQLVANDVSAALPNVSDKMILGVAERVANDRLVGEFSLFLLDREGALIAASTRPGITLTRALLNGALVSPTPIPLRLPSAALGPDVDASEPARGMVTRLNASNGDVYFLVLANDDKFAQLLLILLERAILISIPIGLVATGISAYLISGIALRPLLSIKAAAKQLSPQSIGEEVKITPMPAEFFAVREELELARKRIQAGFATQERFMSNVSHELKTPIATILTEVQVLKPDGAPDQFKSFLRSTTEELEKLSHTIDSFLLLTRVRHGVTKVPASARCYLRDVLLDTYATCIPYAKLYNVRVELRLPEGDAEDVAIIGNCDLLRIMFDNIIRNAVRFSPRESVIMVRAELESNHVNIHVRDRGSGIPPDILPRIFDRFAQTSDDNRGGRGHGLGLEIALGIAELHAGTISVRNCDDSGCEFSVQLPLADPTG